MNTLEDKIWIKLTLVFIKCASLLNLLTLWKCNRKWNDKTLHIFYLKLNLCQRPLLTLSIRYSTDSLTSLISGGRENNW